MQLWELNEGLEFIFSYDRATTYKVVRLVLDQHSCVENVIVRAIARKLDSESWAVVQGKEENANPFATVTLV